MCQWFAERASWDCQNPETGQYLDALRNPNLIARLNDCGPKDASDHEH